MCLKGWDEHFSEPYTTKGDKYVSSHMQLTHNKTYTIPVLPFLCAVDEVL